MQFFIVKKFNKYYTIKHFVIVLTNKKRKKVYIFLFSTLDKKQNMGYN